MNKLISVLIPAYNEEEKIKDTIISLQQIPYLMEIIVINDGSTDLTSKIVERLEVELINLEDNQGKGNALNEGLKQADGEIIALIDADIGRTAIELKKLLKPVLEEKFDMTIAKFPPPDYKGGFGLVTGLAKIGLKFFTNLDFDSPLSGQRVLTRNLVEYLDSFASGFGVEVAMTIKAVQGGFRVKEVPVKMEHRLTGRNWAGFKHRGYQFKDVLSVLYQIRGGK